MKIKKELEKLTLILIIAVSVAATIASLMIQIGFARVASGSMKPTFNAGDIIITRSISKDQIRISDVLLLPYPDNPNLYYSHRILGLRDGETGPIVKTKGDWNPVPDSWELEITSPRARKVIGVLPTSAVKEKGYVASSFVFLAISFAIYRKRRAKALYGPNI